MQLVGDKLYVNRTSLDADAGNYLLMEIDEKTGVQTDSCLKADDYNRGWNFALRLPFSFFYSKNTDAPKYVEMFSENRRVWKTDGDKGRFQSGVVLSQVQIKEQMNGSRCSGRTEGRVSGLVKAEILAGRLIFMQIFTA